MERYHDYGVCVSLYIVCLCRSLSRYDIPLIVDWRVGHPWPRVINLHCTRIGFGQIGGGSSGRFNTTPYQWIGARSLCSTHTHTIQPCVQNPPKEMSIDAQALAHTHTYILYIYIERERQRDRECIQCVRVYCALGPAVERSAADRWAAHAAESTEKSLLETERRCGLTSRDLAAFQLKEARAGGRQRLQSDDLIVDDRPRRMMSRQTELLLLPIALNPSSIDGLALWQIFCFV